MRGWSKFASCDLFLKDIEGGARFTLNTLFLASESELMSFCSLITLYS